MSKFIYLNTNDYRIYLFDTNNKIQLTIDPIKYLSKCHKPSVTMFRNLAIEQPLKSTVEQAGDVTHVTPTVKFKSIYLGK